MKPLVIVHANCSDGFAAAWCFHHDKPDGYDFHFATYGSEPPDVTGREVYIADFSYPRATMLEMGRKAARIVTLDHHKTAQADLADLEAEFSLNIPNCACYIEFDMNRSGAMLAWQFLFAHKPAPWLIRHVQDRDLWKFELEHTREFMCYVNSQPYTFQQFDKYAAATPYDLLGFYSVGRVLLEKFNKDVKETVSATKRILQIGGHAVPAANVPAMMASDAGNLLGVGQPFAATYYDGENYRYFSLRSAPDGVDVGLIAKLYGGGGHKHAAGFRVPRNHELSKV